MRLTLGSGLLCLCVLWNLAWPGRAQQASTPPAQPQAQPPQPGPPAPPPVPDQIQPNTGDGVFSIQLYYWFTSSRPTMQAGRAYSDTTASGDLDLGESRPTPGIMLSIPAGKDNTVRVSYFQAKGHGDTTASENLNLFSTGYAPGDFLNARYTLQNVKLSLDYLSFPFPVKQSKLRLKTLWEVQYTSMKATIDAPLKEVQVDSSGTPISNAAEGTRWFIYPTLGLALEHAVSRNFRWEARASGFGIPHHAAIWDAEANIAYRIDRVEILAGYKGFHFKTSPQKEEYFSGTFKGAYVGLRWYPRW